MRIIIIVIVGLSVFIGSCKPEEVTLLTTRYINNTTVPIKFDNYFGDQTMVNIFPGEEHSSTSHHRGVSNSFPLRLFYFPDDSIIVDFADTLRIVHLSRSLSNDSAFYQGRGEIVLYNHSRSIYNIDSYIKSNPTDTGYEAWYIFTQEDLEYAISVYE